VDPVAVPLSVGPRGERADAARNRELLLQSAREMLDEVGASNVTMDGLAERAGLGKGTVFRHFGTRAGIFQALLDADEKLFQQQVLSGPPPLGPGADAKARLIAYGRARLAFLFEHHVIARGALDRNRPVPAGENTATHVHLRMLLAKLSVDIADLDSLAIQLTGALEGPLLLYLAVAHDHAPPPSTSDQLADSWQVIIERLVEHPSPRKHRKK
jgi:AcrR family transcriptional regulator